MLQRLRKPIPRPGWKPAMEYRWFDVGPSLGCLGHLKKGRFNMFQQLFQPWPSFFGGFEEWKHSENNTKIATTVRNPTRLSLKNPYFIGFKKTSNGHKIHEQLLIKDKHLQTSHIFPWFCCCTYSSDLAQARGRCTTTRRRCAHGCAGVWDTQMGGWVGDDLGGQGWFADRLKDNQVAGILMYTLRWSCWWTLYDFVRFGSIKILEVAYFHTNPYSLLQFWNVWWPLNNSEIGEV